MLLATTGRAANTLPVASDRQSSFSSGTRGIAYLKVLDTDIGQTLTWTLVSGPLHGTVELPAPSAISSSTTYGYGYYTPNPGYVGSDEFTWRANDGFDNSNTATYTITVNTRTPYLFTTDYPYYENVPMNQPSSFYASYNWGGGYSNEVILVSSPSHGTIAVTNNTFTYTPDTDYQGVDSFKWKVRYSNATTPATELETMTTMLVVRDDINGRAHDQKIITIKNSASENYFENAYSPNPSFEIVDGPSHGNVTINGLKFEYTPDTDYVGSDLFTWKYTDDLGESNIATNRILVREEDSRAGMKVLLVVKDTILPEITNEVARWATDLENEGYTSEIVSWSSTSAEELWFRLVSEYNEPDQFMIGATLIGNLPAAKGLAFNRTTDYCFWNMFRYRHTQYDSSNEPFR